MRMEAYMTVAEAAAAIRVSDETVQRACRSGELEHGRVGRAIRILRTAFEVWVHVRRARPAKVAVIRGYDAEMSALVTAWLKDLTSGEAAGGLHGQGPPEVDGDTNTYEFYSSQGTAPA